MSVSHVAGPAITIGGRIIQRCSICGEKLCDSLNVAMPENADGIMPEYATWEVGRIIQVDGNRTSLLPDSEKLPDDSCIDLVE